MNVDSRQIDDGDIKKEIFSQNKVPGEKINEKCSDVQFDYDKDISVKDKLSKTGKNKIAAKKESRKKKVVIADQKEDNRGNKKHTFEGNTNVDENTEKKKKGEIKTDNISSHSKKLKNKSKDEKKSSKKQDYIKDGEVKSKNKGKKVVGKKKKNKVKSFDASDSDNKSLEASVFLFFACCYIILGSFLLPFFLPYYSFHLLLLFTLYRSAFCLALSTLNAYYF